MFAKITTLAFLAVGSCQAAQNWIRGGNTCIGVDSTKPRTTMYGPCTGSSMADVYISQQLVGGGITSTSDNYWNTANAFSEIEPTLNANGDAPASYALRAAQGLEIAGQPGCEFAAAQASMAIGSGTNAAVFQYAAAITTGTAACSVTNVTVVKPVTDGCRDDDCETTPNICVAGEASGSGCTAKEYAPGQIKFSAGFATSGTFATTQMPVTNAAIAFVGYRLKYDFSSLGSGAKLYYNGDKTKTTDNLASTEVTKFTAESADGTKSVEITTGGMYTYGTTGTAWAKTGSRAIKVRSAAVPNEATSVYVDFLFTAGDLNGANKWALYDPVVSSTGGVAPSGSAHVIASAVTVALFAVLGAFVAF